MSATRTLHVSPDFDLPIDVVTESNAVLAKKGAGKTNALLVLLEEMHAAGVPVVTIDPKGDHYGIRTSADGKSEGLPIPVFGGRHGDIPLEPTAGALVADLIIDQHLSVVLDVSEFGTKADQRRFLTAFGDRLYRRAGGTPIHLFLEECHEYLPQQVRGDDAKMVEVFQRIVKLGRSRGIGVTLVSQRSAAVNKDVLTQADNLFVLRTVSPQDRGAVKGWVDVHADARQILDELPFLENGECWLWQPDRGDPVKFRFRMRTTFDAGATPKVGEKPLVPTSLATIDLAAISDAMAATIEKAKAEDPKELLRQLRERDHRITELERALAARPEPEPLVPTEVSVLTDEDRVLLGRGLSSFAAGIAIVAEVQELLERTLTKVEPLPTVRPEPAPQRPTTITKPTAMEDRRLADPEPRRVMTDPGRMAKAERSILTVLAQRGTQTVQQVATLAGYSSSGGGFRNACSALRTAGYIEGRDPLTITHEGLEALGSFEPLPTGRALLDYWLSKFGKAERYILEHLASQYPSSATPQQIAEATGYEATGGGFRNALSKLRGLNLIEGRDQIIVATELGEAAHS